MLKAVVFDLDGTLLDTIDDIAGALNRALASCGLPVHPVEACRGFVGGGIREAVCRAVPDREDRETVERVLAAYLAAWAGAVWLWGELVPALAALAAAVGVYVLYKAVAMKQFGGFTGDLAGWFLQICELAMLAAAALAERVAAIWF